MACGKPDHGLCQRPTTPGGVCIFAHAGDKPPRLTRTIDIPAKLSKRQAVQIAGGRCLSRNSALLERYVFLRVDWPDVVRARSDQPVVVQLLDDMRRPAAHSRNREYGRE